MWKPIDYIIKASAHVLEKDGFIKAFMAIN